MHDIKIELEQQGKSPPFGPIYALTDKEKEALWAYLSDNLAKGFIHPSSSSAASPILFVKKANGSLWLCVGYWGLNAITRRNQYPLPLVNDLLKVIWRCKTFTKIDLKSTFNLLRVASGDEWKMEFRTNEGLFEYLVMPFGGFIQWAKIWRVCVLLLITICAWPLFHRLGEAKFLEQYKLKMNDSSGTALKAIEEEGKKMAPYNVVEVRNPAIFCEVVSFVS